MRPSIKTALAATGSAVAASAVTAAVLLPLGSAFADPTTPTEDWGECTGPYIKDITLEEALPYLEAEGHTPAQGPLDGYDVTYVPEFAAGEPFDSLWEDETGDWPAEHSRDWIDPDTVQLETWPGEDGEPVEQYAIWDSALSVSVQRDDRIQDVESYLEEFLDSTVEDYFAGQDVRELESGQGYYTGEDALWVPEPGVVVTVFLWDESWEGEYYDEEYHEDEEEYYEESLEPVGDHDEVLKIVEGVVPA
ncbi:MULTISPECIES: hypothetical protein [unclassified Nocardiopsis]|uniref:hypothetical protein n=1 Tax=Nocardiopsis TaxID=2013 RepID=UPI00387AD154